MASSFGFVGASVLQDVISGFCLTFTHKIKVPLELGSASLEENVTATAGVERFLI